MRDLLWRASQFVYMHGMAYSAMLVALVILAFALLLAA